MDPILLVLVFMFILLGLILAFAAPSDEEQDSDPYEPRDRRSKIPRVKDKKDF